MKKKQEGVTLISLTVYIIVMVIVVSVVGIISTYFYTNLSKTGNSIDPITEYTKFNSFFTNEINYENIKILDCKTTYKNNRPEEGVIDSYIVFDNGVQYTFIAENQGIYRNQVKICQEIKNCIFESKIENGKNKVSVLLEGNKGEFKKEQTYTLKL